MRKLFCTASLFVGAVALLVWSWSIQMPDWINRYQLHDDSTLRFPLWFGVYVLGPLLIACGIGVCIVGLWFACDALCKWMRSKTGSAA